MLNIATFFPSLILLTSFSTMLYSQATIRQGTLEDVHNIQSPYAFTSPMVLTQALGELYVDRVIDRDGVGVAYSYDKYKCDNVSLIQLYVERTKNKRWDQERLSVWALFHTDPPNDKIVDLRLDIYRDNVWVCGTIIAAIDAEEKKDTEASISFPYPDILFSGGYKPVLRITMIVKDNG